MATSADTLSKIIDTLAEEFNFDKTEARQLLASESLLPKKLMPSPVAPAKKASIWASKKAEQLAAEHGIIPTGKPSRPDGKWNIADVRKLLETPVKEKLNASPAAVKLALEHNIDLKEVKGPGQGDKILVKNVKDFLAKNVKDFLAKIEEEEEDSYEEDSEESYEDVSDEEN